MNHCCGREEYTHLFISSDDVYGPDLYRKRYMITIAFYGVAIYKEEYIGTPEDIPHMYDRLLEMIVKNGLHRTL